MTDHPASAAAHCPPPLAGDPWSNVGALRAAHLRIAVAGLIASVMTALLGCALVFIQ